MSRQAAGFPLYTLMTTMVERIQCGRHIAYLETWEPIVAIDNVLHLHCWDHTLPLFPKTEKPLIFSPDLLYMKPADKILFPSQAIDVPLIKDMNVFIQDDFGASIYNNDVSWEKGKWFGTCYLPSYHPPTIVPVYGFPFIVGALCMYLRLFPA